VLPIVVRAGAGSVRDALSVLDQLIAGSDEGGLRYDRAISLLGFTDDRLLDEVIEAFAAGDGAAVFHAIDHVVEAGHDPRRFATDLLDRLRDLIILLAVPDAGSSGLIDAPSDRLDQMRAQAAKIGQAALTRAAEVISSGLVEMRGATSPRLLLELMCAQVLLPPVSAGDGGLADRLDRLERRLTEQPRQQPPARAPAAGQPSEPAGPESASRPAAARPQPQPAPARPQPQPAAASSPAPARPPSPAGTASSTAPAKSEAAPASSRPPADGDGAPQQAGNGRADGPSRSGGAPDTAALRARWPEVLAAVQREGRVAWMQLSNASVESYADNVLTLAFANAGMAKGFLNGGYDKHLSKVLEALFGISPRIATALGPGGGNMPSYTGTGSAEPDPVRPAAESGGRPANGSTTQPGRRGSASPGPAASAVAVSPEEDTDPSDESAPAGLTGMDLIERELGGRIIQEIGEE
jgi:DNA polymerase-3 subunit gamma/tau